jgi:LCP family protein required for cell wall assembly
MSEDWPDRARERVAAPPGPQATLTRPAPPRPAPPRPAPPRPAPPRPAAPRQTPGRRSLPGRRSWLAGWRGLSTLGKIGYTSATVLTAMAVVISLVAYGLYLKLNHNLNVTQVGGLTNRSEYGVQNILILGSQTRDGQGKGFGYDPHTNLSDNLLLVHLDATHTHATVVSIPRDTMVYEPACKSRLGSGTVPAQQQAIIDGAMNLGGPTCAVATVEHLTRIQMDHFVEFNFNSFRAVVDTLGGVDVCVPQAINDPFSNLHLSAGKHLITGNQALAFVRTRHGVGNGGDLGRIELQQEFFSSLIQKVESQGTLSNPVKLFDIANTATQAVTVDPGLGSISKLLSLAATLRHLRARNVTFITMPTVPDPANTNRLLPEQPQDDLVWRMLQTGAVWHGKLPAPPASTVDVRVLNGTGITGLGARTAASLRKLGFRVTKVADAPATSSTTVSYPGNGAAGGAYRLMGALDHAPAVADGVAGPVTLTLGSDFTGVQSPPRPSTGQHGHHAAAGKAAGSASPGATSPAGQQATVPGQQAGVESRNGAQNICTAMPSANPNVGRP